MKKIAVFGGSFNMPHLGHLETARLLEAEKFFDEIVVVPRGPRPEPEKIMTNEIASADRAAMADLAFGNLPMTRVDLFDLENDTFTRTHLLEKLYSREGEVWHVVGPDLVRGGGQGESFIQTAWELGREIWESLNFAVVGSGVAREDLPPRHIWINRRLPGMRSRQIREKIFKGHNVDEYLPKSVRQYIERNRLYRGINPTLYTTYLFDDPKVRIIADESNPAAMSFRDHFDHLEPDEDPDLILVLGGDGTMLRAIRENWRLRIPFYGINFGHTGFLLNDPGFAFDFYGKLKIYRNPLLYVKVVGPYSGIKEVWAFNDANVQAEMGMLGWMKVVIGNNIASQIFKADGILVSTAAGSSAYARAMGASPILLGYPQLILAGSNVSEPFGWKSSPLPLDADVTIMNHDESHKRELYGFADGQQLGKIEIMEIRTSRIASPEIAFVENHDPVRKLMKLQFPK